MMPKAFDQFQRHRLISSYFTVVVSITLVLFVVGIMGLLLLNTQLVSKYFKEQIALSIYFEGNAKTVEISQLETALQLAPFAKRAEYVSKEQAASEHSLEIGENFMDFLGYNPLKNSIDLYLNATFVNAKYIDSVSQVLEDKGFVSEVVYDRPLIVLLNENIKRISYWILILSGVFTLIAVLLVNSSIRLSIYSKRMIIKTMQLVGAKKSFIRKPFVWRYIGLGLISACLSLVAIWCVVYFVEQEIPQLSLTQDIYTWTILSSGILGLSFMITALSSFLATQRYLKLKSDYLY